MPTKNRLRTIAIIRLNSILRPIGLCLWLTLDTERKQPVTGMRLGRRPKPQVFD